MDERSLTGNKAVSNLYPVHRLDSITSGVLLCAKSKEVAGDMGALFESHSVHKYVTSIYIYIYIYYIYSFLSDRYNISIRHDATDTMFQFRIESRKRRWEEFGVIF